MAEVRLIDANALTDILDVMISKAILADTKIHYALIRECIAKQPTIESKPVRHGRWIFVGEETMHDGWTYRKHKCSECDFLTVEAKNFCQNCGSKMYGGAENG